MSARCGPGCGWCGRCTAAWERDDWEDEQERRDFEEEQQRRREQNDATFTRAVRTWCDKKDDEVLEPPF